MLLNIILCPCRLVRLRTRASRARNAGSNPTGGTKIISKSHRYIKKNQRGFKGYFLTFWFINTAFVILVSNISFQDCKSLAFTNRCVQFSHSILIIGTHFYHLLNKNLVFKFLILFCLYYPISTIRFDYEQYFHEAN